MRITAIQNIKQYTVTANQTIKQVRVVVNPAVQKVTKITVAQLGARGYTGISAYEIAVKNGFVGTESDWLDSLKNKPTVKIAGESIPSHTAIALFDNKAYKLDPSNSAHQFAFIGFSLNGSSIGQECIIKESGEVYLSGWGLVQNQHYLAGINGTLITNNSSTTNFTKVIGYATTADSLKIVTLQTTNK